MFECPLYGENCEKELHEECENTVLKYSKIVWCKDFSCSWNLDTEQGKTIKHHKDYVSLGKMDDYRGICSRPEIGLSHRIFDTGNRANGEHHEVAICDVRSNKKIKGHLDWSKILDQNKSGTHISDPIESFPPEISLSDPDAF